MRVFVDTNIFLDVVLGRQNSQDSLILLNAIEKNIFEGIILDITIPNIDYVAKKQVREIREFLTLVNSTFEVIGATNTVMKEALEMNNADLEDNLQYICAKLSKCDVIVTNDKAFPKIDIDTLTSQEFVEKYLG
ncbi:MAG: PIN domain-containing protein [Campylobacterales bacterium]|nr:PIN domain-containing protein [Campylobacterales bacterium]